MKLNIKKIITPGAIILALSVIVAFIALIVYGVNVSSPGYFRGLADGSIVGLGIIGIILAIASIVSGMFEFDGIVGKVVDILRTVIAVIVPVLFMICFLNFAAIRVEGLAYIFGSDANLATEVQTPENLSSATTAIVGFILFAVSSVIAIIGSFFSITRKAKDEVAVEAVAE